MQRYAEFHVVSATTPDGPTGSHGIHRRARLFALVQELVIKVAAGAKSIRVPLGEGIAGHVGAKCAPPRRAETCCR
jgi:hypothetical protein